MAAGKTSAGRALANASGRRFVDLDDTIDISDAGSVGALVARDEPEFRRREAAALARVIAEAGDGPIVATGGGAAAYGDNMDRMRGAGCVVALGVDVATAVQRAAGGPARPLLADAERLAARRAPTYRRAHAVVDTTTRSIDEVARAVRHVEDVWHAHQDAATIVALDERSYPIIVADAFGTLPARAVVITDREVARHHAVAPDAIAIEPGEASKCFATYERLCGELVARGLDRTSTIVAVGGGVVGDLAGFVAASLYRGIAIEQWPTTLVAMTDAAIGGKTAIDLPAGKNLVGAFHQPRVVWCNLAALATLPPRERRAGFGELWKYALLDGGELWRAVDACTPWAAAGGPPPPALREVIRACAAYKAAIVGRDERERTGQRTLLNLGHTIGHAIEAGSGLHHGEAVGLGLIAAARVSAALGLADSALEADLVGALRRTGLPDDLGGLLNDDVLARIAVDKKRAGDEIRFIAVREVGACEPVAIAITELRRILRVNAVA
jgi:shikimate kinase/3-dehydroquinate synthase